MKFAFLFLTYDNLLFEKEILNFVGDNNIYIHPKYPNKVHKSISKYIIKNIVETKWAECSIVNATLNLLKESYENIENKWFILLSSDTYPLCNIKKLNKLSKSIFLYNNMYKDYYKTSQWWILKRDDVNVILNTINKYKHRFHDLGISGACDEFYFLSVLMWENPKYEYINMQSIYTRFLKNTLSKHPVLFNKLTSVDNKILKKSNALFIRKVTSNFSLKSIKLKKILCILTIGTYTKQNDLLKFIIQYNKTMDFILFVEFDDINNIFTEIINNVLYVYIIKYKYYYDSIISLCITENNILKQWKNNIIFIPEVYDYNLFNISGKSNIFDINKHRQYILKNNKYDKQIKDLTFIDRNNALFLSIE
jgi:hypothetical protein